MKYIDTVIEDSERLKKARKSINYGVDLTLIGFTSFAVISMFFLLINYPVTATFVAVLSISYLILMVGLIIKREIFSVMIYLKEKK